MDVEIDFGKSLERNASAYFEKSKAAKRKIERLRKAMAGLEKKASAKKKKQEPKALAKKRKRQWFQAFHWFRSSDGFLVIGGKDARSNEAVVKKHFGEKDMFLHADIQGGAACIVKAGQKKVSGTALKEASVFAACWSKAWQQRLASVDVYAAGKEQVSKKARSGEALSTGGFMVYGKRQWFRKTPLRHAVGLLKENASFYAMGGPPSAVKKHCISCFEVVHGGKKRSDTAKQLLKAFEEKTGKAQPVSLDEIIEVLPGESLAIRQ